MTSPANTHIRFARETDLPTILDLLRQEELPTTGVGEHMENFLVAEYNNSVVGSCGLELYGDTALLRSVVVASDLRGTGVGSQLIAAVLPHAQDLGIRKLVLLTNTAEAFFTKKGFRLVDRMALEGPVTTCWEFREACPDSAVCMQLLL